MQLNTKTEIKTKNKFKSVRLSSYICVEHISPPPSGLLLFLALELQLYRVVALIF